MKVLLRGPFVPGTGYGHDLFGITAAFIRLGADVYIQPTSIAPPIAGWLAKLLTRQIPDDLDLVIHHADPNNLGDPPELRSKAVVRLAWTMWEASSLDSLIYKNTLARRIHEFDVAVGYDDNTVNGLLPYCAATHKLPEVPIAKVQGGFSPEPWQYVERDWGAPGSRFSYAMLGALMQRKQPMLAVRAFQELKDEHPDFEGAELHLRSNVDVLPKAMEAVIPKLRIHTGRWSEDKVKAFYASQHVLLAPSRGEGKNLPALEFMATGGTVIATNWGGHGAWLSNEYAYPLDYELKPVDLLHPDCLEAHASKDHLKELMLHVYRNREAVHKKGMLASSIIPQMCSWDSVIPRLMQAVARVLPEKGEWLKTKAAYCTAVSMNEPTGKADN